MTTLLFAKPKKIRALSVGEESLDLQLKIERIAFQRQYKFSPERKWKADFAILRPFKHFRALLIEVEGGIYSKGRHIRPMGFIADMEKYNEATFLGFGVARFTTEQVTKGYALNFIKNLCNNKERQEDE